MVSASDVSRQLLAYAKEYAQVKRADPTVVTWAAGAVTLLSIGWATSPGRKMSRRNPPPLMRRLLEPTSPKSTHPTIHLPARTSMQKLRFLLNIAIPSRKSREMATVALISVLLLVRTFVSVRMAKVTGLLGKLALEGDIHGLLRSILTFIVSCVPAAVLDNTLNYLVQVLDLFFRENLTRYLHQRYITDKVFFHTAGLHAVDHIEQGVTDDVRRWSAICSSVFMSLTRPLVEAVTFTYALAKLTTWRGPALTWGYYLGFVGLAVCALPNLDWMANDRMEKEANYRAAYQKLLLYSEEIIITNGQDYQKSLLARLFRAVTDQSRYAAFVHARFNLMQFVYTKYGSILIGYIMCALGAVVQRQQLAGGVAAATRDGGGGASGDPSVGEVLQVYSQTSHTFALLAKAIGRFLWNIKLVVLLNGYTQRVYQLIEGLDVAEIEVSRRYETAVRSQRNSILSLTMEESVKLFSDDEQCGRISRGPNIEFIGVPLTLPTGDVLCASLSFHVDPGMNLLIMGPNGCGKSSTFRLLGELWPLRGGRLIKPEQSQMYYVPQRPYMYDGTLFEQIIYPQKRKDASVSESELYAFLEMASLGGLLSKPGVSWDSHFSWSSDQLSAGEKQRLAMARLFYHRPRFAILDECSSTMDLDVERQMYEQCRELGISLITIAHRRSVWQYHNWVLQFDGNGGYLFSPLRFEDNGNTLVLTNVVTASDPAQIGKEVIVQMSGFWDDEMESADRVARTAANRTTAPDSPPEPFSPLAEL